MADLSRKREPEQGLSKTVRGREIARVAMLDSTNKQLAKYEAGMLACVETADWAQVAKGAGSIEILARRHALGKDIEDHAFGIKTEAERGLGLAMAAAEKATGTRGQLTGRGVIGGSARSRQKKASKSLADQGVDKALANKARKMATLTGAEATPWCHGTRRSRRSPARRLPRCARSVSPSRMRSIGRCSALTIPNLTESKREREARELHAMTSGVVPVPTSARRRSTSGPRST